MWPIGNRPGAALRGALAPGAGWLAFAPATAAGGVRPPKLLHCNVLGLPAQTASVTISAILEAFMVRLLARGMLCTAWKAHRDP